MEKVILTDNIKLCKNLPGEVSRVYFGNEFCDHLICGTQDIDRLVELTHAQNKYFSIVTPFTNQRNFKKLERMLEYLNNNLPRAEVVVNDWGVMHFVKQNFKNLEIVMGRLLTRQKRGFFIKVNRSLAKPLGKLKLNTYDKTYLKSSILENEYLMNFIKDYGIRRVGLDNITQGPILGKNSIKIDLYYPYVYVTTSNYCLTAYLGKRSGFLKKVVNCDKLCKSSKIRRISVCGKNLYLRGNAQFYFNDKITKVMEKSINRLVEVVF